MHPVCSLKMLGPVQWGDRVPDTRHELAMSQTVMMEVLLRTILPMVIHPTKYYKEVMKRVGCSKSNYLYCPVF